MAIESGQVDAVSILQNDDGDDRSDDLDSY